MISLPQFSPEQMTTQQLYDELMEGYLIQTREQIQEDILSYASLIDDEQIFLNDDVLDALCNIVCDNFTALLK